MAADPVDLQHRYRNLIGWTWLSHGGLLVLGAPGLLLLRAVVGLIGPDLVVHLAPRERAQIRHLQELTAALAGVWPALLAIGLVLTPLAIAFLRGRRWARPALEVVTWLHVLVLFPLLGWWLFSLPPALLQFDDQGQPLEVMRIVSHVSHGLTLAVMEGLGVYLLVLIRRPVLRTDPGG